MCFDQRGPVGREGGDNLFIGDHATGGVAFGHDEPSGFVIEFLCPRMVGSQDTFVEDRKPRGRQDNVGPVKIGDRGIDPGVRQAVALGPVVMAWRMAKTMRVEGVDRRVEGAVEAKQVWLG